VLVAALVVVAPARRAEAQLIPVLGGQRAGTATAQFLKIGVGGRAVAMAESFVAVANDASALYWNPAGLVQFPKNELIFSHVEWPVEIRHEFIGYVHHLDEGNAVGLSATALHMDELEETTEFQPFGTGRFFSFGDVAVGLSYARKMTDRFSFGGTVKFMEETLAELKMRGVLVDIGTFYWTGFRTARFAIAVTNFGAQMKPQGRLQRRDGTVVQGFQDFPPPITFKIGFATELINNAAQRLTTSLQLNHPNDNAENVNLGAEYWWNDRLALRGGYRVNVDEESFALGAGLKIPLASFELKVDYAYTAFGRLGSANRFALLLNF